MPEKTLNISLALGWNERYDHKVAVGIIKFARQQENWRLLGNEWLLHNTARENEPVHGIIARINGRDHLRRLRSHRVPIVDVANAYAAAGLPQAVNDDFLTGRMAALHLLDKGFAHLAYLGVAEATWSDQRRQGMEEVLADRGRSELLLFNVANSWQRRLHHLTGISRWLKKLPLPCGIIAANDLLGYRLTLAAAAVGLRIPEDLAVVGVDNEDVYCHLAQPTLTSISCDCERIGQEAARLLAGILNGEDPLRQVVVPPLQIDVRESSNIVLGVDRLTREVMNFIAANIKKGINVADVAAAFPLSRRALEKRFRHFCGKTLHQEITETRLERARQLLAAGESPAAASRQSGYQTIQHFYHAFKDRFGMTPIEYRNSDKS